VKVVGGVTVVEDKEWKIEDKNWQEGIRKKLMNKSLNLEGKLRFFSSKTS
jgi:hypothetical protein